MSSEYRGKVVEDLKGDKVKIPTNISKGTGIRVNHISKILTEFKNKGILECINEDVRNGRLYILTPIGIKVSEHMEKIAKEKSLKILI